MKIGTIFKKVISVSADIIVFTTGTISSFGKKIIKKVLSIFSH